MRTLWLFLFLAFLLPFPAKALFAQTEINGLWLTENKRSVIKILPCEQGTCGIIHWIVEGGMQDDTKNPYESRRGQPMCGLTILWDFKQTGATKWTNGRIYKADDGDMYKANMELEGPNLLEVRGYVGIPLFGKTQKWTRVQESDYPPCKKPEK